MKKSKLALSVTLGLFSLATATSVWAEAAKTDAQPADKAEAPKKVDVAARFYEPSNNAAPPSEYSLKDKPNIIVFVLDDLGYGQVDYDPKAFNADYLSKLEIPTRYQAPVDKAIEAAKKSTPTIRQLADNGMRLKQGFVAHGVSGPSRAAIMTARFPARFGVYSNNDIAQGVKTNEKFLAERLQNHGYRTAAIGKWHLCVNARVPVPKEQQTRDYHDNAIIYCNEPYQPQNRGFDYFFGFHASGAAYYKSPSLFRNRERAEAEGYLTEQITNEAIEQLRKAGDDPAFLYVAYNAPHIPLQHDAPKEYQIFDTGNHHVDNYYAYVYAADQGIKKIIGELEKEGKLDNTLIFFTSDNGSVIDAPLPMNGVFKGFKGETHQGGVHVPFIATWPKGGIKAGSEYNHLISAADIMPTALAAAGIDISKEEASKLDGVNLLPYLKGEKAESETPHEYLFWVQPLAYHWDTRNIPFWEGYDDFIDGNRDAPPNNPNLEKDSKFTWTVRDNDWTMHYYAGDNSYGLFKNSDTLEEHNLLDEQPEVAKRLKLAMRNYLQSSARPQTDNNVPKYEQLLDSTK